MKIQKLIHTTFILILLSYTQACSQRQVVHSAVSVAKLPVKAASSAAGATGRVVGGAIGGAVGGNMGKRVGRAIGDKAGRASVPKL